MTIITNVTTAVSHVTGDPNLNSHGNVGNEAHPTITVADRAETDSIHVHDNGAIATNAGTDIHGHLHSTRTDMIDLPHLTSTPSTTATK
jgi:hypothetical protein